MTDPLDGADVGETVQATETQRYCWWGSAGSQWLGEDRETENLQITDAYFDGEPGNEEVVLEISGEVTRRLPRAAFDFPEPTGPKSTPTATPTPRWKQIAGRVAPLAVSSVITVGVFVAVFNKVAGSISVQIDLLTHAHGADEIAQLKAEQIEMLKKRHVEDRDPLQPSEESPQMRFCSGCESDTLHSWDGESWICESCGGGDRRV